MIDGAHNLPDDVIETASRRAGIVCMIVVSILLWLGIYGCVSLVWGLL